MAKIVKSNIITQLRALNSFRDKCIYWNESVNLSFFETICSAKSDHYKLIDDLKSPNEKLILFSFSIERLLKLNPNLDFEQKKLELFDKLKRSRNVLLTVDDLAGDIERKVKVESEFFRLGYVSYNGLSDTIDIAEALELHLGLNSTIPVIVDQKIKEFYSGYRTAILLEEIKEFDIITQNHLKKEGKKQASEPSDQVLNDIRIPISGISMAKFGALIYQFAMVLEIFPYATDSKGKYSPTKTARMYYKIFKVLKDGKEVAWTTFLNSFKTDRIEVNVDKDFLNVLSKLPLIRTVE